MGDGLVRSFISGLPHRGDAGFKDEAFKGSLFCERLRQALEPHAAAGNASKSIRFQWFPMVFGRFRLFVGRFRRLAAPFFTRSTSQRCRCRLEKASKAWCGSDVSPFFFF